MNMHLAAQATEGRRIGTNADFFEVTTDSRSTSVGDLFVALRGERFDGHDYAKNAVNRGATGIMVEAALDAQVPQVVVDDTNRGLGRLAAHWRRQFDIPLVAVTGSNGKTTVKEMIGTILQGCAETLVSHGNFNNDVGLPLSLLKLRDNHEYAVVEIGMNQIGEIEYLANLACPTVAIITNANAAHIEYLQTIDRIAHEKGRILSGLGNDGVAVLNVDDPYFSLWRKAASNRKIVTFGLSGDADIRAEVRFCGLISEVEISTPQGSFEVSLRLPGIHNVRNALAAAAAALAAGISLPGIRKGLASTRPIAGRLRLREHRKGGILLDDCYNSNPTSVAAALDVLSNLSGDRRVVLGDMFELGENSDEYHREVGNLARRAGVGRLYGLGTLTRFTVEEFGRGARHYEDRDSLITDLANEIDSTTTLLVKGSRGMQMERIVEQLLNTREENGGVPC